MRWSRRRSSSKAPEWSDIEPGWGVEASDVARAMLRGARRPLVTLPLAVLVALFAVAWKAQEAPHETLIILKVSESRFSDHEVILSRGALEGWVDDVVFTSERLFRVTEDYDLYPTDRALGRAAAVAKLRDNLEVKVLWNYFLMSAKITDQLRSARIALTFRDSDYDRSQKVAMALAQIIIDFEVETQKRTARAAREIADKLVRRAEEELTRRQRRISEILFILEAGGGNQPAALELEARELTHAMKSSRQLLRHAREQRDELELNLTAEERLLARRITIADVDAPQLPRFSRGEILGGVGVVTFFLALPLAALAAGAFDARVRDEEDIIALGVPAFGPIPALMKRRRNR